jgi:hypothetical protein
MVSFIAPYLPSKMNEMNGKEKMAERDFLLNCVFRAKSNDLKSGALQQGDQMFLLKHGI